MGLLLLIRVEPSRVEQLPKVKVPARPFMLAQLFMQIANMGKLDLKKIEIT